MNKQMNKAVINTQIWKQNLFFSDVWYLHMRKDKYFEQAACKMYVTTFQTLRQSFSKIYEQFMSCSQFM